MASSRSRTITTVASRRSTPPSSGPEPPVRRSPRGLPHLNYREKRTRTTSSMGSTGGFGGTLTCLKIQLKTSLINSSGETQYCGSGVFILPEWAHRSSLNVRTREILADILGAFLGTDPKYSTVFLISWLVCKAGDGGGSESGVDDSGEGESDDFSLNTDQYSKYITRIF